MKTNSMLTILILFAATLVSCQSDEALFDDSFSPAPYPSGMTTRSTAQPAGIYTPADLMHFASLWNTAQQSGNAAAMDSVLAQWSTDGAVGLYADIDMAGMTCPSIRSFTGTFTGRGHIISNLTIQAGTNNAGLFSKIQSGGVVADLILESCTFSGLYAGGIAGVNNGTIRRCTFRNGSVTADEYAGGIAGYHFSGSVEDCIVDHSAEGNTTVQGYTSGGIAGKCAASISGCRMDGIRVTGEAHGGGIAGLTSSDACIDGCTISGGSVTGTDQAAGGIVAGNAGQIRACLVAGNCSISSSLGAGGITGTNAAGVIKSCVSAPGTITSSRATAKGIVSGNDPYGGILTCYWAPAGDTNTAVGGGSSMIGGGKFDKAAIGTFFTTGNPTPIADMNSKLTSEGNGWIWQAQGTGQLPMPVKK